MSKVFELKTHADKLPSFASTGTKIESLELCENTLYIGSSDGYLREYKAINESFILDFEKQITSENSPVTYIRSASALNKLLVLSDSSLMALSVPLTEASNKTLRMKGISLMTVNANPRYDDPFAIQICAAKKKHLVISKITEGSISTEKTKELPELISSLAMDGAYVLAALGTKYVLYNYTSGDLQDLFEFGSDVLPGISRISKEEFLLNAQLGLGMFVTSEGIAKRPPIQWLSPVNKFIHLDPYVITLSTECISIYSLLDNEQKHVIQFSGGRLIGNYDGQIFLASSSSIYRLAPIPIEKRIQMLLASENAEEALNLIENEATRRRIDENFEELLRNTKIRAGFIFFKKFELDRAKNLFLAAELDPRELISLYPGHLSENSHFVREIPPLHNIADVNQVVKGDKEKVEHLKDFLKTFLGEIRRDKASGSKDCREEINLALVKLLVAKDSSQAELAGLVCDPSVELASEETKAVLNEWSRHHASALFHKRTGSLKEALKIWVSLIQKHIEDSSFPGLPYLLEELNSGPEEYLWEYADFALSKDQEAVVDIFKHKSLLNQLDYKRALDFLKKYPRAHLLFLEHLVLDKHVKVESLHSQLAIRYLELIGDSADLEESLLEKFRSLIMTSDYIQPQFLLSRLEKTNLHRERAILYGKMGEHEKALGIFVSQLKDFEGAERYCDDMSRTRDQGKKLLSTLLRIYVSGTEKGDISESTPIALVNRRSHEMHPVELIRCLPPSWSIDVLNTGLRKSLRSTIHEKRMGTIRSGLSRGENVEVKFKLLQLLRRPIVIDPKARCVVCKKSFHGCHSLTRFPNGVIAHSNCIRNDKVCPLTGEVFE
eukprot:TRINITY_DN7758_c0_g1_i1.p1 TRINITY_DN7758_c0_g1~~TRINITY_DN7758_c0_g1_i1.p1  ORF type:complete len:837 (+),score=124.64 TRINITY_DN7758_c0_g1_i1:88-2598(+)